MNAQHIGTHGAQMNLLGSASFLVTPRDFPPFFVAFSATALLALYSILFCSKCGSFRYSSKESTRDTGAYLDRVRYELHQRERRSDVFEVWNRHIKDIL